MAHFTHYFIQLFGFFATSCLIWIVGTKIIAAANEDGSALAAVFKSLCDKHGESIKPGSFPWSEKSTLYLVATAKGLSVKDLTTLSDNIAQVMSYWGPRARFIVYGDKSTASLFEQLKDSRVSTVLETYTNSSRTHRLAFGRNLLLETITHSIRQGKENPDEVFVAVIDLDNVNFHKHRRPVFEGAMNLYHSWESVSFYRAEYYDVWALRYKRFDNNFRSSSSPAALCPIIRRDLKIQMQRLNSSLYPVVSAFNGFAVYRYKAMRGCHYIGHSYKRLDDYLADPNAIGEDCEHVAFHKCMIAKHKARIMIYSDALILEPFVVNC